jgi:hypothetical protein
VHEFESELLRHPRHRAVGQSATRIADLRHQLLGESVDIRQVVVLGTHELAQLGVGATCLLWCGNRLTRSPRKFGVQPHDDAQGVIGHPARYAQGRKTERGVQRALLQLVETDLERGACGRRFVGQQVGDLDVEGLRNPVEQREARFALAVLHEGQLAAGDADGCSQLVERESLFGAEVTDALSKCREVAHS